MKSEIGALGGSDDAAIDEAVLSLKPQDPN
jgi:hypothetical protein